eukprot:1446506-Amphidinium_carterae.1
MPNGHTCFSVVDASCGCKKSKGLTPLACVNRVADESTAIAHTGRMTSRVIITITSGNKDTKGSAPPRRHLVNDYFFRQRCFFRQRVHITALSCKCNEATTRVGHNI